jgi:hypothetical protein
MSHGQAAGDTYPARPLTPGGSAKRPLRMSAAHPVLVYTLQTLSAQTVHDQSHHCDNPLTLLFATVLQTDVQNFTIIPAGRPSVASWLLPA